MPYCPTLPFSLTLDPFHKSTLDMEVLGCGFTACTGDSWGLCGWVIRYCKDFFPALDPMVNLRPLSVTSAVFSLTEVIDGFLPA